MNKERRRRLRQIVDQGNQLLEDLRAIQEEEQDALDNMPESLQGTERYEAMEMAGELLEEAADNLEDLINRCLEELL